MMPAPDPASDCANLILDAAVLRALAADIGADGAAEAARIFLEDAPARIARMRLASGSGDAAIRHEAHALAGSARAVGLVRLGEAAGTAQCAVEAALDASASQHLEALLLQGMAALEAWLATQTALT